MSGRGSGWVRPGEQPYSDGDTSRDAAVAAQAVAPKDRARVLGVIRARGSQGATDDEIEVALGLSHQTASARRRELVLAGEVVEAGGKRLTRSGSPAKVWRAKPPPLAPGETQGRLF